MVKKEIDTKEYKNKRILTVIDNLEIGETISPTKLFKEAQIHPNTGRDLMDLYESLNKIGFQILRDSNGKIKGILRTDENLNYKNQLRSIQIELINLQRSIENMKEVKIQYDFINPDTKIKIKKELKKELNDFIEDAIEKATRKKVGSIIVKDLGKKVDEFLKKTKVNDLVKKEAKKRNFKISKKKGDNKRI